MKLKHYLAIVALALLGAGAQAQQPYAGCWFPDDVRDWTPEYDKDAKFNRSRVPLKKKLSTPQVMKANEHQFTEGQLMLESVSAKMCGQCAAQGFDNFIGYNHTYWQYVEKLVNWGGADDEGIIVFPPAGTVDAAHAQGTKVFATIFFQPTENGGPWAHQITSSEEGKYPYAEQLYKMARYYGIDGYFINDESGQRLHDTWVEWIKYFYSLAEADGDDNMEIVWYDATVRPDADILKINPRSSHFLDYNNYEYDHSSAAAQIGCSEADIFHKVYNGVECARSGLNAYDYAVDGAFPRKGHVGSLALFCPEEGTWKSNVSRLFFTDDARGPKAYDAMRRTFENERSTYVNDMGDPSNVSEYRRWRGFAGCLVESTTIDGMPFITSFNVGNGKHRFDEGVKAGTRDWSHSGMQSYLPTWRWWIENGDMLTESIDWDDAYCGGNSMLISGYLSAGSHLMRLYKMIAKVDNGGTVRLVYKSNNTVVPVLRLSTESSVNPDTEIQAKGTSQTNGWTVAEYDLASVAGKTIYMVAFDLKADAAINSYEMRLGQMVMIPAGYSPNAVDITNVSIERALGETGGDLRLTWDWADNADLDRFDIYTVDHAGNRTLAGQTRDEGFYIPEIPRQATERSIDVEIIPVMKDGSKGTPGKITAEYPVATAPAVTVRTGCSYAKVGQEVTLTASGTFNPTACRWTLPAGVEFADGYDGSEFVTKVKATALGKYSAKVSLTNEVGSNESEAFVFEAISDEDYADIKNIALNKTIHSESTAIGYQSTAANLIDGERQPNYNENKWCSVSKNPYAVIDLGDQYIIYGFTIYDCNSGKEKYINLENYRISVSGNAIDWTEVVNETGRGADDVKYDYISPVQGRYVRLAPYGDNNITTRIWEFEVYGREAVSISMQAPATLTLPAAKTTPVTVTYDLKGLEREENFGLEIKADRYLTIDNIAENADNHTFKFDVTTEKVFGAAQISLSLTNGTVIRESKISVDVDVTDAENVLRGLTAEVRKYSEDYSPWSEYTSVNVDGLTDGNTTAEALEAIEDASTHEYDVLAIIDCGRKINLSKIKVWLPGDNYGTNLNDLEGIVNHDITLRISTDNMMWTEVKVYSDLGRNGELSYILPDFQAARYIAVACNLNPYFYASLAEIEAYEQVADQVPVTRTVEIKSGFNCDAVAEAEDITASTNGGFDDEGYVFYTTAVKERGGLPVDGKISAADYSADEEIPYQLGDYTKDNAMKLKDSNEGTLVFATPVMASKFYILSVCAGGYGTLKATVNYSDGTSGTAQDLELWDWYQSYDYGFPIYGLSRVNRNNGEFDTRYRFLMNGNTIDADITKEAVSISFENAANSTPTVMAISMTGRDSRTSGIDSIEAEGVDGAEIEAIYTLEGIRVDNPRKGINIIRYTDGTTRKVIVR